MIIGWILADYLVNTCRLLGEYLLTTWCVLADYLVNTWWVLAEYLVSTCWLIDEYLLTSWWVLADYLMSTCWLLDEYLLTTRRVLAEGTGTPWPRGLYHPTVVVARVVYPPTYCQMAWRWQCPSITDCMGQLHYLRLIWLVNLAYIGIYVYI